MGEYGDHEATEHGGWGIWVKVCLCEGDIDEARIVGTGRRR